MELARLLGGAHPLLVHFPIALLPMATLIDLLGWWRRSERLAWCGYWLTLLGTVGGVCTFVCGILAELFAARSGVPQHMIEVHEWLATFAVWTFIAVAVARILMGVTLHRRSAPIYLLAAIAGCALLVMAAHRGGQVTYAYGANVTGVQLQRLPSDEDLAVLAQHQREDTLQYSNQMHWIFGGIVLALAASVLLERLPRGRVRELRRIMPLVFVGGGVYLAIFSDWDSWPISTLRPLTDPEVLLHKFIALLLVAMGVLSWRKPPQADTSASTWQNRVIAVMSAIGGGLLFTHVHTNAPYTNVAVGVYLNHSALGLAAFGVGAAVLLADAFPQSKRIAWLFPLFLAIEGALLLTYNEDLPWFAGYHRISNQPTRGGVLAHLEKGRAELTFDRNKGVLDLYLLGAHDAQPLERSEPTLDGVIEARQRAFPIAFTSVESGHYQLALDWLRAVPVFNVRLGAPLDTSFDPIVTAPLLPPLEGAEVVYACAMCPDVRSSIPGTCSMCGMTLEALPKPEITAPAVPPHDPELDCRLAVQRPPKAGEPVKMTLTPVGPGGATLTNLHIMHEKLMHLMIVRDDLNAFDHVHPIRQSDGSFVIEHTFPSGGQYVLFAEIAPTGRHAQRFRIPVTVDGPAAPPPPHRPQTALLQQGDYTFSLDTGTLPVRAGGETPLTVSIYKNGRPVEDLTTWLGAAGHCVIISSDTLDYVHAHALQLSAVQTPAGPDIAFHARLPRPGRYRMWAQLAHGDKVLTADFDLEAR
ncbi:MAG: hypothetical protein EB084_00435 [Proteobacteria bacterium]|nr:hypothetical protein [Pseudomonadota bacterium]